MKANSAIARSIAFFAVVFFFFSSSANAQWSQQAVNTQSTISTAFFTSVDTGYAAGNKIFKTTDGGITWTQKYSPVYSISKIYFTTKDTGFAVSTFGYMLYKTIDGGQTWDSTAFGSGSYYGMAFINPSVGFITGSGSSGATILKTTDDGGTWTAQNFGANSEIRDIQMVTPTTGYAAGFDFGAGNGLIYKTTDGGNSWSMQTISILPDQLDFMGIYFTDTLTGYAAGHFVQSGTGANIGVVYKTTDGGLTWSSQTLAGGDHLNAVQFVSDSVGYIGGSAGSSGCGGSVIFKTTDAGTNWAIENTGTGIYGITAMYFPDANNGYAFERCQGPGTYGALLKYGTTSTTVCYAHYSVAVDSATSVFTLTIDPVTLFNTVSYLWDFGDGTTSTQMTPSFVSPIDTVYNVCMTAYLANGDSCTYCHLLGKDSSGNIVRTPGFSVNVVEPVTTGVTTIEKPNNILIYPNPTSGEFTIALSAALPATQVKVFDVLGKMVFNKIITSERFQVDLSAVQPGMYIVEVIDKNTVSRIKLEKR